MNISSEVILVVEDNEDDVFLMKWALKEAGISKPVHVAEHGQDAIDYLAGTGRYSDRTRYPIPFLVFLDLKLPYKSGFEVFAWIRTQPSLQQVTVAILTSSPEERDRKQAGQLGAQAYLIKPPTADMLTGLIRSCNGHRPAGEMHELRPPR